MVAKKKAVPAVKKAAAKKVPAKRSKYVLVYVDKSDWDDVPVEEVSDYATEIFDNLPQAKTALLDNGDGWVIAELVFRAKEAPRKVEVMPYA